MFIRFKWMFLFDVRSNWVFKAGDFKRNVFFFNSLDDLESLFFNVLTVSSSIINSSKGVILIKNEVSNIFDVFSEFNLEDAQVKKQIFNTRSGFLKKLNKEKKGFIIKSDDDFNHNLFNSKYSVPDLFSLTQNIESTKKDFLKRLSFSS